MAKINENVFKELINKKSNRDYNEYTNRELSISFATSMMALSEASGVFTDIDIVNLDKEDKDIYLRILHYRTYCRI